MSSKCILSGKGILYQEGGSFRDVLTSLDQIGAILGPLWYLFGSIWDQLSIHFGPLWSIFGPFWDYVGAWGSLWESLGASGGPLGFF